MAFIDTVPPDRADPAVAAMYLRQQSAWGYVPNYAKVFCHRPEVMARWAALLAEIRRPMDARTFELATFAAAHELRNTACALAHGKRLLDHYRPDTVVAIAQGDPAEGVTGPDQALLRYARQVARDAASVTQEDVDAMRAGGYTDAEVFDIAAAAAARAFFTKLLDAMGVQMDSPFLALDDALRQPLTVGRPIDGRACEVMAVEAPRPD